jgi:hypothetical protein
MTIAEAAASGIPVYDELIVTKDAALTACNAGADGVEYGYLPRGIPSIRERSRIITSVFAHKWGTPDINGFRSLLAYISRERGMGAYALPVASHGEGRSSFVVCSTPNPDCGTETTISSSLEVMVPWLVSNPALIGKGKTLLSTGVRAEDQLRTHNNRVAVVYSPEAWFHTRANEGRREENSLETFLSEDFGDLLAALVRMHLGPDGWSAEFSCLEGDDFTRGFYQQVVQPGLLEIWDRLREAQALARSSGNVEADALITQELITRVGGMAWHDFEATGAAFLAEQLHYVSKVMKVYVPLLYAVAEARDAGMVPIKRFLG